MKYTVMYFYTVYLNKENLRNVTVFAAYLNLILLLGKVETEDGLVDFLVAFAKWEPLSQDSPDAKVELMRSLMLVCKKQGIRNEIGGGAKVDQAVNAVWAAMVYHTPTLHHSLRLYGSVTLTLSNKSSEEYFVRWLSGNYFCIVVKSSCVLPHVYPGSLQ